MSSGSTIKKYKNDKQIQAVISNIKEQQNLDRVYETLKLERSHSLKLLRLDYIQMKAQQRRMENRISKIRSHLSVVDIAEMKQMELEGRLSFKPSHTSNSALRIASAAERLKLRPVTAERLTLGRTNRKWSRPEISAGCPSRRASCPTTGARRRYSSASAAAVSFRESGATSVRFDAGGAETPAKDEARPEARPEATRPRRCASSLDQMQPGDRPRTRVVRSMTATGFRNENETPSSRRRPRTAIDEFLYSSHDLHMLSLDNGGTSRKRMSLKPTSLADAKARDRADDRRKELLERERTKADILEKKREEFIGRTVKWLEENPPISEYIPVNNTKSNQVSGEDSDSDREDNKVIDVWKDLRKCRYLRIQDNELDLSAITTKAMEQLSMYQSLNNFGGMKKPRLDARQSNNKKNLDSPDSPQGDSCLGLLVDLTELGSYE